LTGARGQKKKSDQWKGRKKGKRKTSRKAKRRTTHESIRRWVEGPREEIYGRNDKGGLKEGNTGAAREEGRSVKESGRNIHKTRREAASRPPKLTGKSEIERD